MSKTFKDPEPACTPAPVTFGTQVVLDIEFSITGPWAWDHDLEATFNEQHSHDVYEHLMHLFIVQGVTKGRNVPFAFVGTDNDIHLHVDHNHQQGTITWRVGSEYR